MNIRKAVDYSAMFAALESAMEADLPIMYNNLRKLKRA